MRRSDSSQDDAHEGASYEPTSRTLSTLVGLSAIAMWALLGVLTKGAGPIPPFLLCSLCFGLSGFLTSLWLLATGRLPLLRQPLRIWALGVFGLFGFHAFYFTALSHAPVVEANLINYLWPLLIVLLSGLLPGEALKKHHLGGALLGFLGAALLIGGSGRVSFAGGSPVLGYVSAFASALIWALYSVLSRRAAKVPTEAVAGFCLATAVLSLFCHIFFEEVVFPDTASSWISVALLAVFPLGLAFFTWDHGVKKGDIKVLGAASYVTPLLSTLLLILAGYGHFSWSIALACLLVTGGALLAAGDLFKERGRSTP